MSALRQLRAGRPAVNIQLRSSQTAELLAIVRALQTGLRTTLEYLAEQHGFEDGPWLDELEKALIGDVSNIWAQGLPIETELKALEEGRRLMQTLTNALRSQLWEFSKG